MDMYSAKSTSTANNLEDISIEREYLYWTNSAHTGKHGSVHKAFTEPFRRQVPFQTYEDYTVENAKSLTTNNNYLFFTGNAYGNGFDPEISQLFIQRKNGASYFVRKNEHGTKHLKGPSAVSTYKDTLLLVANQGFIS